MGGYCDLPPSSATKTEDILLWREENWQAQERPQVFAAPGGGGEPETVEEEWFLGYERLEPK